MATLLDLNQSKVIMGAPFTPMLKNLQANILKGHGRNFAYHLFFQFKSGKANEAKTWIRSFASSITSAEKQLEDTAKLKNNEINDGGTVMTLSLSSTGYDALGKSASKPTSSGSFTAGMKASKTKLLDDPKKWEHDLKGTIDLLIIVADDTRETAKVEAGKIVTAVAGFAKHLKTQAGNVLKMENGVGVEHNGYADGISQPIYLADEIAAQGLNTHWQDETLLSRLLVPDPTDVDDTFGSYFVFRRLEQNVFGFKSAEGDNHPPIVGLLPSVKDVTGTVDPDIQGAMIVGRFENSTPIVVSNIGFMPSPPKVTNDFDYSDDLPGTRCPFHAHTRLMNPRNGNPLIGDVSSHRITRRAIPYDDIHRFSDDQITELTTEMFDNINNQPTHDVGLLFMCYQSLIEDQFEVLQGFWAQGEFAGDPVKHAQDSIMSQGNNPSKTFPKQWGQPAQSATFKFGDPATNFKTNFVTTKGGEYFFTPSIRFLETI